MPAYVCSKQLYLSKYPLKLQLTGLPLRRLTCLEGLEAVTVHMHQLMAARQAICKPQNIPNLQVLTLPHLPEF